MKTKSPLFRIDRLLIAALALLAAPQVQAQTVVAWTNTNNATSAWNTGANWSPARSGASGANTWTSNDIAQFNAAGSNVTRGINFGTASGGGGSVYNMAAIEVTSLRGTNLTINSSSGTGTINLYGTTLNSVNNVILRNGSSFLFTLQRVNGANVMNIALSNSTDNVILVDGTGGITISSVISGADRNLTIRGGGSGTVTLATNNTFSGTLAATATTTSVTGMQQVTNVVVNGGTLNLGASDRFLDTAAFSISSGTLGFGGFADTVGSFTISGGTFTNGTLTASSYALQGGTVAGNLGAGTATVTSGTTALNGTLSATTVNVNSGTMNLGSANRLADAANVTIAGGTLGMGANNDTVGSFTMSSGTLGGSGTLTASTYALQGGDVTANLGAGSATVTTGTTALNGTLGAGTVEVNSGTMNLGSSDRLANGAAVTIAGGTLGMSTFSDTVSSFTISSGTLGGSTGVLTASTYALQGGTINAKLGAGAITVTTGTTGLGSAGRLDSASTLTVNSGQLDLGGNETVASLAGSGGTVGLGGNTLSVGGGNTSTTYDGTISGIGGALTKTGSGTLTLTGTSGYTGATTVSAGTLNVTGSLSGSSAVGVSSGALLTGGGSVGAVTVNSGGIISAGNGIGSAGTLSVASLAVAGTSTYRWEMSSVSGAAGTGYDLIASAGAFDFSSLTTFTIDIRGNWGTSGFDNFSNYSWKIIDAGSLSGTFDPNLFTYTTNNATGLTAAGTWTFTESGNEVFINYTAPAATSEHWWIGSSGLWSDSANWSNNDVPVGDEEIFFVSATGGLSTNDSASSLTGITFTNGAGAFTISGNAMTIGSQGVTNLSTAVQTIENNLTLGASQNFDASAGDLVFSGTLGLSTNSLTVKGAEDTTISGAISGSGAVFKQDAGILTLSGANSYSGGTLVGGGTLLGSTTSLQGSITNNAAVVFDQSTNGTYSGAMSGSGSLTKNGSGAVTLSGANSYLGGNTINGGTLIGSTASVLGAVSVASGATLALDQSTNGTFSGAISGSGRLVKDGSGNVTLSAANSYSGGTLVSGGTLTGDTTSLQGTITNNAAVAFSQSTNGTYASAISGSGSVTKSGSGTLTLSGANSYNGGTTVSAGALAGNTSSLQGDILNNAAVVFSQTSDGTYSGTISGTGALVKSDSGSITMSGGNSYAGGTTISSGALVADNNNALGSGAVTMSGGSVLATAGRTIGNSFNIGTPGSNTTNFGSTTVLAGWDFNGTTGGGTNNTLANTLASGVVNGTGLTRGSGVGVISSPAARAWGGDGWNSASQAAAITAGDFVTFTLTADPTKVLRFDSVDPWDYRRTANGPPNGALQYSTDGVNFTDVTNSISYTATSTAGGTLPVINLGLMSDVASGTTVTFRIVNWGAALSTGPWYLFDVGNDAGTDDFSIRGQVGTVSAIPGSGTGILGIQEAGAVTFSGTITNNSTATLTAAADGLATFSGIISGVGIITKSGAGTVVLSGANTYSGGTLVTEGVLAGSTTSLQGTITNNASLIFDQASTGALAGSLSGAGSLIKTNSGTLILTNAASQGGAIIAEGTLQIGDGGAAGSFTGPITNNATLAFNRSDNLTHSGVVSGAGSLTKSGLGTVTLSGGNTYGGGTTISAGALKGDTSSLQGNIANSSLVIFDQSGSGTYTGALSGSGALIKTNSGTVILTGASTQGGTTIGQGTLQIGDGGTLGSLAGAITNNGTLAYNRSDALTQSAIVSGTGALTQSGAGTVTLDAANSYSGATAVNSGALRAVNANSLGTTAGGVTVASGAALELSGGTSIGAEALSLSGTGISLGGALRNISGDNSYAGVITLGAASRINSDAGTLTINSSGSITGGFNLVIGGAGNVDLSDPLAIGVGALTKDGSGTLTVSTAATHAGGTTLSGGTLRVGNTSTSGLGTGTLALNGGVLSGNNTVTRTLTNNVTIGGNVGFGDGTATGGITLSGPVDLGAANRTLTALNTATLSGTVSGAGAAITKDGAGTLVLGGANSFDGGVTLNAGTLRLGNTGALGSGSLTQLDGTSRVDIDVAGTITNDMSVYFVDFLQSAELSGALTLNNATFDVGIGLTATNSGVLDGLGGVTKTGVGTLVLSGANTYEGATSIEGGAISVSSDGNLGAVPVSATPGHLSLDGGKLLATTGFTLDANRGISLGAFGGFIEVASTQELTYGGVAEGVGRLTKLGLGTLTLSGANNYSGGTLVSAGTLSGDTTSLQGGITNNAVLEFNQATNGSFASVVSGNGSLVKSGGGVLTLTAANTYGGGTLVSSGTLSGDTTSLQGTMTNNAAVVFDQATNGTYAGVLSGSGTFTKDGAGALTLSGANTVSGATTVNAGTLELNNGTGAALGSTASVSVASRATLLISQSNQVNNSATVSLSGGTISRASGVSEVFGALTVSGSSILDFGSGTSGSLAFGAYTPSSLLTLNNFFGGNVLSFNSDLTGSIAVGTYDTTSFLSGDGLFQINSISGGFTTSYSGGTFTITAIPEPSTYAAAIGLLGLMLWPSRKRLLKDVKSVLGLRAPMRDRLARRGELRAEG